MKRPDRTIVSLKRSHLRSCNAIVSRSEPWKTLREKVDLLPYLGSRSASRSLAYVCLVKGSVAGFLLFTPEPVFARGGYLRAIAVAPRFRGQGIGRALLEFAERKTAARSSNLFLCVSDFNLSARAFYKSCGFRKAGSLPGLIRPSSTELILWKRLR